MAEAHLYGRGHEQLLYLLLRFAYMSRKIELPRPSFFAGELGQFSLLLLSGPSAELTSQGCSFEAPGAAALG